MSRATHKFKSRRDKYLNGEDKNYQRFLMAIRGHHIYKDQWAPSKGIKVTCFKDSRSEAKEHDRYPVGVYVKRSGKYALVGHVPIEISQLSQLMTNFVSYRGTCIHGWLVPSEPQETFGLTAVAAVLKKPKRFRPGTVSGISKASQETCCIHAKRVTITP